MLIAIDPDVFTAAMQGDKDCERLLQWIREKWSNLSFAFDQKKVLQKEYVEFLGKHLNKKDHPAILLLDQLLNYSTDKRSKWGSNMSPNLDFLVNKRQCLTPVEPTLIGMGENTRNLGLTVLLVKPPGIRKRCLHDSTIKTEFQKQLPNFRVEYATNLKISFPTLEESKKSKLSYWFEDKARTAVCQIYKCPHFFTKTPPAINNAHGVGEIDIYCYEHVGNPRQVWIGECKLREVNQDDWITAENVKQLAKKLAAIQEYEVVRSDVSGGSTNLNCFIVSNANNMENEAWAEANKFGFKFLRVYLTESWQQQNQWGIEKIEEYEPIYDETEKLWQGKLIKKHVIS